MTPAQEALVRQLAALPEEELAALLARQVRPREEPPRPRFVPPTLAPPRGPMEARGRVVYA